MTQFGERFWGILQTDKRLHLSHQMICYITVSSYLNLTLCKGKENGPKPLLLKYILEVLERRLGRQSST